MDYGKYYVAFSAQLAQNPNDDLSSQDPIENKILVAMGRADAVVGSSCRSIARLTQIVQNTLAPPKEPTADEIAYLIRECSTFDRVADPFQIIAQQILARYRMTVKDPA